MPGQNTFRKAQICLFASADPGRLAKRWSSFFPLPAVRVAMVTKWTLADQGFVSTMLWLKFRSDGYPSCVWGLCSSSEDAKARLGWLVVVHDVPGPLAVFRERGFGKSQWRAVHVRRDQTFVFLRDRTGDVISTSRGIYH